MADSNAARDERRSDMREFTAQLVKLTDAVGDFGERMAGLEQWTKTANVTIGGHNEVLHGNGKDGLIVQVDRLNARVSTVFAVGAGAWALFVIAFTLIAANLFEKLSQLLGTIP